jgi:hypothetical protein
MGIQIVRIDFLVHRINKFSLLKLCAIVWRSAREVGNVEADRLARIASAACAGKGKRQNLSMKRTSEDPPSRINNRKMRRYCPY